MSKRHRKNTFPMQAREYWKRGLDVVPVAPGTKAPAKDLKGWPGYLGNPPNADTRATWDNKYAQHGIGLLPGGKVMPGFVLVAIDIDQDPLVKPIVALIGGELCAKFGKKGLTLFARAPEKPKPKKRQFRDSEGQAAVDFLTAGAMTVVPPTIHPDTGKPYHWKGKSLLDVDFADLPIVDKRKLAIIEALAASPHIEVIASGKQTHDAALRLVFDLVKAGAEDEEIERVIKALLPPEYTGDTLQQLPEMIASAHETLAHGKGSSNGTTQAEKLVEITEAQDIELFCSDKSVAYIGTPLSSGGRLILPVRGRIARRWFIQRYFEAEKRGPNRHGLSEFVDLLEARAFSEDDIRQVHLRVAQENGVVTLDLGRDDGQAVIMTKKGWSIAAQSPVAFVRHDGFGELPMPSKDGLLEPLRELLGLEGDNWHCLIGFLLNALRGMDPYMCLLVDGAQGSGKSLLCQLIKRLIDPHSVEKLRLPENDRDLMIHTKDFHLLVYDNASYLKARMSDMFCMVATGGSMVVKKLYTDDDAHSFSACNPFIINSITPVANRPDLLERGIPQRLGVMPTGKRKTEKEMLRVFEALHPAALGALCDAVCAALRANPERSPSQDLRMIDSAIWMEGGEKALGLKRGSILKSVKRAQGGLVKEQTHSNSLVDAILKLLNSSLCENGVYEGTMGQLHTYLTRELQPLPGGFPRSSSTLSSALKRLELSLEEIGVRYEVLGRNSKGLRVRLTLIDGATNKAEF